jgi:6,7-dimethyl-8-ribityllumazine synthase
MPRFEGELRAAADARFALVAARWNPKVSDVLLDGARRALIEHGVAADAIDEVRVPGAWELPLACARLADTGRYAGLVALGCVVRGDTRHYEQVADGCASGLMHVALEFGLPVANGVLAVERFEDAAARAGGVHGNKGEEAALAAMEMANLCESFSDE